MATAQSAGAAIYYETSGEGPALLFAHGAGGNAAIWFQQTAHFAGRFMAPKRVSRSGGESLVFGAHRRGMDFDDDPVILRFRRLNADDASLLFSAYGDLFHRRPVSPPLLNIDASAQSVF